MNNAASLYKAVILLSHTIALLGDSYIVLYGQAVIDKPSRLVPGFSRYRFAVMDKPQVSRSNVYTKLYQMRQL